MAQSFWVSTGDIRESYSVVNILTSHASVATPFIGQPDYAKAHKEALDKLARDAVQLGANGVIWVSFSRLAVSNGVSYVIEVFASGTAVKVNKPQE